MKRKILNLILCTILAMPMISIQNIYASTESNSITNNKLSDSSNFDNNELIISYEEEAIQKSEEAVNQFIKNLENAQKRKRSYYDYEYKLEYIGSQTEYKKPIGYPSGQPSRGTVFANKGGFFWSEGGPTVDVSISVAYKALSVSVALGETGNSGRYIETNYLNTPVKLFIHKDITAYRYKIYKKIIGTNNWIFDQDYYDVQDTRDYLSVIKV